MVKSIIATKSTQVDLRGTNLIYSKTSSRNSLDFLERFNGKSCLKLVLRNEIKAGQSASIVFSSIIGRLRVFAHYSIIIGWQKNDLFPCCVIMKFKTFFFLVPPSVWIQSQLIGEYQGNKVTLECHCQAFPKSINYWTKDNGEIIPHSKSRNC